MNAWIEQHRSRIGVGKYSPRTSEPAPVTPARQIVAEIVPAEPETPTESAPEDDGKGPLRRLEEAERISYRRYVDSGGSEGAAQVWLLCTDQLRKFKDSAAKLASDVSEGETNFLGTCAEVILSLKFHLQAMPRLLGVLCEGLGREQIEAKAADQIERTLRHAASDLADTIRGTSLEVWLAPEGRGRRFVRPDANG
jgi:hypothetical protein